MKIGKILLTGCTGLVGHGIGSYFLDEGYEVIGTSRGKLRSLHSRFSSRSIDLLQCDSSDWRPIVNEVDLVIHCAALMPGDASASAEGMYRANAVATASLLEAVRTTRVALPVLYISGTSFLAPVDGVISPASPVAPKNAYVASKLCGEIACRQMMAEHGLKTKILRTRGPYGYKPTAKAVIPKFLESAENSRDLVLWGSGQRTQTFTFVEDIARACEAALLSERCGTWIVAGPRAVSMKETAETVLSMFPESSSRIVYSGDPDPQESSREKVSISEAAAELGFVPKFDLQDGLRKIVSKKGLEYFAREARS